MRIGRRAASLLALLSAPAWAQSGGSVAGSVVNSLSGAGVAGMNLLLWAKGGAQYQATTDDYGAFRVDDVQPGSYRARFEKEGFVPLQQDDPPVLVTSAPEPARIRVEMSPYATLSGRVVGPDGNPAADVIVELRRAQGGAAVADFLTAGDGSFTFKQLSSGSFLLFARPKTAPAGGMSENRSAIVPTYFPSVEERAQAERIQVRAGLDLSGYEIHLRSERVYRISGTVVDESGRPVAESSVALISTAEGMSAPPGYGEGDVLMFGIMKRETETGATTGKDGRFTFSSVRPGPWRLLATSQRLEEGRVGGALVTTLADHDLDDLQIRLAPLLTLTGTVEFKEEPQKLERYGGLMLATTDTQGSVAAFTRPDGSIRFVNLIPGAYRVAAVPGPFGDYSPASVLLGDREVLGQVVQLSAGSPPLRIVFTRNTGVVRGTIEQGPCDLIVLLPDPLVPPVAARSAPCTGGASFEIQGVPSGKYYAVAFDRIDTGVWPDESFLRSVVANAPVVQVGQGPAASVQLTISHWPE